jgi:hypothetical protein
MGKDKAANWLDEQKGVLFPGKPKTFRVLIVRRLSGIGMASHTKNLLCFVQFQFKSDFVD